MSSSGQVTALARQLHSQHTLKAWSLVVTFFGDSVLPRGGRAPLALVVAVLAELGVDATTVRAAVARLTRDGWLVRERRGRTSDYRLDDKGLTTFSEASDRIYARGEPRFAGRWTFAITALTAGARRNAVRKQLRAAGFGALGDTVFLRPECLPAQPRPTIEQVAYFNADNPDPQMPDAQLAAVFDLATLDAQYRQFIDDFSAIQISGSVPRGAEAAALRTLLIHEYRRVVLRDPHVPDALASALRHRERARGLAAQLYGTWLTESEAWLESAATHWQADPRNILSARF
ncbi:MAG: PaaX family transcriptional regulator C-terminal domain-containing protein [Pseudomonadota bacterium]